MQKDIIDNGSTVEPEPIEPEATETKSNRRDFLSSIGAKAAMIFGITALAAACKKDDDNNNNNNNNTTTTDEECPDETVMWTNALTGDVVDGTAQDYSPTTGGERTMIPSACWQCVSRDGIVCYVEDGRLAKIEGNPKLPRTGGKLCARGQGGVGQVYDPDRLLFPMRRVAGTARGDHQWERISWEDAMTELATKCGEARAIDPKYLYFHYGRMKASSSKVGKSYFLYGFGTKSYSGHTSICESSKWTSQELVWGKHYDINDVARSNMIINFGCNPMATHTSHIPLTQRVSKAIHENGASLYTFDPRLSETAMKSTKWLPIMPGTDLAVILAMMNHILVNDLAPQAGKDFINDWTNIDATGFNDKVDRLRDVMENPATYITDVRAADVDVPAFWDPSDQPAGGYTPAWAESVSGVPAADIIAIAEEYAANSPGSTIITYRGAVMHFNGTITENAAQTLEGLCGNINAVGGRVQAVGASWSYKSTYPAPPSASSSLSSTLERKSHYVAASHGASHQVLAGIKEADQVDRPMVYMVYCYTPAYANGDIEENIQVLKDETMIPYIVCSDVAYTEAAMYADLVLPDTNYLERWDWEDMVSYDQIPEYYIRQPVVTPMGEARNMMDVLIDLSGRLSSGPADELEKVAAIGSMENFVRAACNDTAVVNDAGIAAGYADGFEFMKAEGAYADPAAVPVYGTYDETVTITDPIYDSGNPPPNDGADYVLEEDDGVIWEGNYDEWADGYRATSSSYKHYLGQKIDNTGTIYKGFKPDKVNKGGTFEVESKILERGHYPALPVWTPVPEHANLGAGELILTTYKIPTQSHSRTQNCKYLSEISHHNPALINAATAAALGITDGSMVKLTRQGELYNDKNLAETRGTMTTDMTVEVKVTEGIHPGVIAISHSHGHWAYGRYASGEKHPLIGEADHAAQEATDPDSDDMWWNKHGYRPNWLIPNAGDPIAGGLRFFDTVVLVEPA